MQISTVLIALNGTFRLTDGSLWQKANTRFEYCYLVQGDGHRNKGYLFLAYVDLTSLVGKSGSNWSGGWYGVWQPADHVEKYLKDNFLTLNFAKSQPFEPVILIPGK